MVLTSRRHRAKSNMTAKPIVYVILGPTGSGKSDLAVNLALQIDGEVISADSRQVYRGMDIGTGKITKKEMHGVPHHLLDVADPTEIFTVSDYKKLAEEKIKEILARGNTPIICGGTGFYIDAITKGIILPEVSPDHDLRRELENLSNEELFEKLKKLDPARAKDIENKNELNNKVRLIRAIEIAEALGNVPEVAENPLPYHFIKIGIKLPEEILKQRIEKRVHKMFADGLLGEIENLKKLGVTEERLKQFGFEYYHPTPESVITKSIQYTKRQMTWWKRDQEIIWL